MQMFKLERCLLLLRLATGAKLGTLHHREESLGARYRTIGPDSQPASWQLQWWKTFPLASFCCIPLTLLKVTAPTVEPVEEKSSAKPLLDATSLCEPTCIRVLNILAGWAAMPHQAVVAGGELVVQSLQLALKTGFFSFFSHFLPYTKQSFLPLFVELSHFSAANFLNSKVMKIVRKEKKKKSF